MRQAFSILYFSCLFLLLSISCSNSNNKEENNNSYTKAIANIHLGTDKKTFEKEKTLFLQNYPDLSGIKIQNVEAIYYNNKVVRILIYSEPRDMWSSDSTWCSLYREKYSNFINHKQHLSINNGNIEILVSDNCKRIYAFKDKLIPDPLWECLDVDSIKKKTINSFNKAITKMKKKQENKSSKKTEQQKWQKGLEQFYANAEAFHSIPSILNSNTLSISTIFSIIDIKDKNLYKKLIDEEKNKLKTEQEQEKKKNLDAI